MISLITNMKFKVTDSYCRGEMYSIIHKRKDGFFFLLMKAREKSVSMICIYEFLFLLISQQ